MNWSSSQIKILPIAYAAVIIIAVLIGLLLNKKSDKVKNLPFLIITILLITAEFIKQIRAIETGYTLWTIPLHYCSMFLVWFSLASFFKGKIKKTGQAISYVTGFAFLIAFNLEPSSIIGNSTDNLALAWSNFGSLHNFYYHFSVILFFFLQITLHVPFPTLKELKQVALPFFSWMIFASIIANLINTNFTNLLHNNILFMQTIQDKFGYVFYLFSMFFVFFAICLSILALGSFIRRTRIKRSAKNFKKL
jgi:hypothetical protein